MDRIAALVAELAHDDHATRLAAFHALNDAGVNPIEAARKLGKRSDLRVRINAAAVLLVMGMDIGESLQVLGEGLKASDAGQRYQAAFSLAVVGVAPGDTVAVLIEASQDRSAAVREEAAAGLSRLGHLDGASKAVPALGRLLDDESSAVRRHSAYALANLGAEAKVVLPALAGLLRHDDFNVRQQALYLMHQRFGVESVAYFMTALKDRDGNTRWVAANYLGRSEIGRAHV